MDSSCLPTIPCSALLCPARCVIGCQHFILCIANDGSGLQLFDLSPSSSPSPSPWPSADSWTNEILPEVSAEMVRGAKAHLARLCVC